MTGLFITTALKNVAVFCVLIWNYVHVISGKVVDNFIVLFHLQKINTYANVLVVRVCKSQLVFMNVGSRYIHIKLFLLSISGT